MIRKTAHYAGHVQGVGFRMTARQIARGYDVSGYVKNLPDGRVELVAEGEKQQVDAFLADVEQRMAGHIRDRRVDETAASGQYGGFGIAY